MYYSHRTIIDLHTFFVWVNAITMLSLISILVAVTATFLKDMDICDVHYHGEYVPDTVRHLLPALQ